MSLPSRLVDIGIGQYQRHLSPRKGFTCAHLVAHGGQSCSAAVRGIIASRGLLRGTVPTVARFFACYQAASALMADGNVQGVCCCGGIPIPFRF